MRAVAFTKYGGPEVLRITQMSRPFLDNGEVLIRSAATPVNPADLWFRQGALRQLMNDAPFPYVPGLEVAGTIEAAGREAPFNVGDKVTAVSTFMGTGRGTQAEFSAVNAKDVALVPPQMSMGLASTLPMNSLTALAAVDALRAKAGDTVIILGAAGHVGRIAVQIAHRRSLEVIAIANARDQVDLVRLGATRVIDRMDVSQEQHDCQASLVLDCAAIGAEALSWVTSHGGRLVHLRPFVTTAPFNRGGRVSTELVSVRDYQGNPERLASLLDDFAKGRLESRPIVELDPMKAPEAHDELGQGGIRFRHVLRWQ